MYLCLNSNWESKYSIVIFGINDKTAWEHSEALLSDLRPSWRLVPQEKKITKWFVPSLRFYFKFSAGDFSHSVVCTLVIIFPVCFLFSYGMLTKLIIMSHWLWKNVVLSTSIIKLYRYCFLKLSGWFQSFLEASWTLNKEITSLKYLNIFHCQKTHTGQNW